MNKLIPILHNIRSLHNVGSILRTCDGLGIDELWVSGYTPYPQIDNDKRLPHVIKRASKQIAKTALGAENNVRVLHFEGLADLVQHARSARIELVAVEQTSKSTSLEDFQVHGDIGLIFGNEVDGLDEEALELCDQAVEIPMKGKKESFNISISVAIVLYALTTK